MATDPETLARYQKANGYLHRRIDAAPLPALRELAASDPPRPAPAREAAGAASWDNIIAAVCAEKGLEPRGGLAYAPRVSLGAGDDRWDAAILAVCAERGLKPRGSLAYAPGVSPSPGGHLSREAWPTTPGALPWSVIIEQVSAEAGFEPCAIAPLQTSPRGAPLAPSFAAPHADRASTNDGAASWDSIIAQVNKEAGLTNKARGRANE